MKRHLTLTGLAATAALISSFGLPLVMAEPIKFEAVVSQKESLRLDFADGSKRYLVMVRREGKATGQGPLGGATATEWGAHDVTPGLGANSQGYLVFSLPDGDTAYLKYLFRVTSLSGLDGKPKNLLNGSWEVVGASGKLKGLQGAGTLRINIVGPTDRHWILDGEMVHAK